MSAFDELERQLAESVLARGRVRRPAAIGGLGRWWRGRLASATLALAVTALVILATAAGAPRTRAGAAHRDASIGLLTADASEIACAPCRAVGGRLHGPLTAEGPVAGRAHEREVLVRHGVPTVLWANEAGRLR